jgi:hypothetical protein
VETREDEEIVALLNRTRFVAPPVERVWRAGESRRSGRPTVRVLALVAALVGVLTVSLGLVAAREGWFSEFVPGGQCPSGDQLCGTDYAQVALSVDHRTDTSMVNVLVKPGLSSSRLQEIAKTVAQRASGHRVIVSLFTDLPPGPMNAGFAGAPMTDSDPAPRPLPALLSYWVLTYDQGASGVVTTTP